MRLIMRSSPTSRVCSIEPEGITRAWPMVPLMSRKINPTQNQAMTSRRMSVGCLGCGFLLGSVTLHQAFCNLLRPKAYGGHIKFNTLTLFSVFRVVCQHTGAL